jgi:hypothetical protein
VLEAPALEILLEPPDDELRQPVGVQYALPEPGPVLSDRLVERSLLRPAARVAIGSNAGPSVRKTVRRVSHDDVRSPDTCPA